MMISSQVVGSSSSIIAVSWASPLLSTLAGVVRQKGYPRFDLQMSYSRGLHRFRYRFFILFGQRVNSG